MKPVYLKFPNEAAGIDALRPLVRFRDDGSLIEGDEFNGVSVAVLGRLETKPVMDGEKVVTPAQPIDGWHVNLLIADGVELGDAQAYVLDPPPTSPRMVFGGFGPEEAEKASVGE